MLIEIVIIIIGILVVIADFLYSFKKEPKPENDEAKNTEMSLFIKEEIEKKDARILSADNKITELNKQVSSLKEELDNANKRFQSQQAHSAGLEKELSELKQKLSGLQEEQASKAANKKDNNPEESAPDSLSAGNGENSGKGAADSSLGADGNNYVSRNEYDKLKRELESKNKSLSKMYLSRRISNIQKSIKKKIDSIDKVEKVEKKEET